MAVARDTRRLAAILAADVVGYSRLIEGDEAGTLKRLKTTREEVVDPKIAEYGGRIVKTMGDGLLAEFASAVEAVQCAVEAQQAMAEREADSPKGQRIEFRIGINLGDVIIEDGDMFGDGVIIAARLEALAEPGGILISATVHDQIAAKVEAGFVDGGEQSLKNLSRPVRVFAWRPGAAAGQVNPAKPGPRPSVAVLPLQCMSSDRELEYLADGLTEDLITLLARTPSFLVISRRSTFAYKGTSLNVRTIAHELGVRYLVEGSLRPVGGKLRVTIQLIEAETGNHLWADQFDKPADELVALQDEVTAKIVAHLAPELASAEIELVKRHRVSDLDAWTLYQQASTVLFRKGWNEEAFTEAASLFHKAIELDPKFALAHANLSLLLAIGHVVGYLDDTDEAFKAAETALDLDSGQSEVLGYAGCALADLRQHDRGIEILERAIELNPANAQAWAALGAVYLVTRRVDEAVDALGHGLRISPRDPRLAIWGGIYALALMHAGRLDEAIEEARAACRRDGKLHNSRVVLAAALMADGQRREAASALAEARRIRPELSSREVQGLVGRTSAKALAEIWSG